MITKINSKVNKKLITFIFGTRPEAIKLAPIILTFQKCQYFKIRLVSTGQHKEMLKQALDFFNLKEDLDLGIMKHSQTIDHITTAVIKGLHEEFKNFCPNLVIVQGDTTSAMASALAAFYNKIPIVHVEAGLRTDNLLEPYPEEANRRIISQIASLHCAPTEVSKNNLERSGVVGEILVTGNSIIDALKIVSKKTRKKKHLLHSINLKRNKIILATIHRRENIGESLENIADGFLKILEKNEKVYIFLPLHKNKSVREPLEKKFKSHPRIILSEPLNYIDLISMLKVCEFVLTDSGGLQEEAPSFGKPVLILRDTTERPEGLTSGTSKLIGTNKNDIFKAANELINNSKTYSLMAKSKNPFGDGKTSQRILEACRNYLKNY